MKHRVVVVGMLVALIALCAGTALAGQLGGGVHYLVTVGDIKNTQGIDDKNFNLVASYKQPISLLSIEADVEFVPDYLGSNKMLYQPQAYALIGGLVYGGAGIGWGYIDGHWLDDPFYALRAGVDVPLGKVHLDVNGSYRFLNTKALGSLDKADLDSVTFGAIVRFDL